jgi:DNA repair protein RecN (Recombination protein N)
VIDTQGKSRAWINGCPASITQLREAAEHLVDIHGQHAWQSLTRPAAVRALLDDWAQVDGTALSQAHAVWRQAGQALASAQAAQAELASERDRLAWQIGELEKLNPQDHEWESLNQEHKRLSNAQALMDHARLALEALSEAEVNAISLTSRSLDALSDMAELDPRVGEVAQSLREALPALEDAARSLSGYLGDAELEPQRLQELDERLSAWMGLARRHRRPPAELPALLSDWRAQLTRLEQASDLAHLEAQARQARLAFDNLASRASQQRRQAAPGLAAAVTQAMQQLGMAGGRFDIALQAQAEPQSFGMESAEFLVAGHEGSTARPLAKVASGGELSRLALAIAVTTRQSAHAGPDGAPATLIFDEIDSGVGGAVAESVGKLMRQLSLPCQVLAVTHLPQVAACAHTHWVVSKATRQGVTCSELQTVSGEARVQEIARMLGGERLTPAALAHAQELLGAHVTPFPVTHPSLQP